MLSFHDYEARKNINVPTVAYIVMSIGIQYCVIGTMYGFIHTSGGGVRTWKTASGARRAAKKYVSF